MKNFNEFLDSLNADKLEFDILNLNFSSSEYEKILNEFTPEQFRFMCRLSKAIALAYLRQYDLFLREQFGE